MSGLHSSFSRHMFTLDGKVLTSGGAKNLAKGQFAIIRTSVPTVGGAQVVSDFSTISPKEPLELRLGKHDAGKTRTARNSKAYASENFNLNSVTDVYAKAPKFTSQKFDEVLLGYDGINEDTAINLEEGQSAVLDFTLSGEHVGFITGYCDYSFKKHFTREIGETNQQTIERVVEELNAQTFPQGVSIKDVVSISKIDSTTSPLSGDEYTFFTLALNDRGDSNDLAIVQSQYPTYSVKRTDRIGDISTYTILAEAGTILTDYAPSALSYIKDCEDCLDGYTEIEQGFVYSVQLNDNVNDNSSLFNNLQGYVANSAKKVGADGVVGTYLVVVSDELTQGNIQQFKTQGQVELTSQFTLLGDVAEVCEQNTPPTVSWTAGESCFATTEKYTIQLKDDNCDGSVLADLQAAYPELIIAEGVEGLNSSTDVVLVGLGIVSNGDTVILTVDGTDYQIVYNTNLPTTASDFVNNNAADLLANQGVTVTAEGDTIIITHLTEGYPTLETTVVNGVMDATVGETEVVVEPSIGGCQRVYNTNVVTNIVCDECSDIFLDTFISEAPDSYNFSEWVKLEPESDEDALLGIRFKGKSFKMTPSEVTKDVVPFYETSTRINVSGGYVEEVNLSYTDTVEDLFSVRRVSRAQDRDNLGAHLMGHEEASRYYFDGEVRHKHNLFAKYVLGEESVLDFDKQYVAYHFEITDNRKSQGAGRSSDMGTIYVVWAEIGKHRDLEVLANSLAAKLGLPAMQVLANS